MKSIPRILYIAVFIGLGAVAALALNRVLQPSAATVLIRSVFVAAGCAAPGLIYRRLWPLALVLLPLGCYLLLRTVMPLPAGIEGVSAQYHFYVEQLHVGAVTYNSTVFPLALGDSPELRLLMAFVTYWLVGAAGFLALSLRQPMGGIVPALVLLGFSSTVDATIRVLWPVLLFIILAACLFVLSRALDRQTWRVRDAVAGGLTGVVGSGLALALLIAAPSVAASPWKDWKTWNFFNSPRTQFAFNWLQNYPQLLNPAQNAPIMRVTSPLPSYWRASALDTFTGSAWVTSRAFLSPLEARPQEKSDGTSSYSYDIPNREPTPPGKSVTESFDIHSVYTNYFFVGGAARLLTLDQQIALRVNDMGALRVSKPLGPNLTYSLTAVIPEVKPGDLVGLGSEYPDSLSSYVILPFPRLAALDGPDKASAWRTRVGETPEAQEWAGLYDLNKPIVGDATDPYDVTLRIERYLRQSFTYSLQPALSQYSSPYAAFLFDTREGYCQHFAGAMAVLLRFNGIPSRVAVGFATGEQDGQGQYVVSTNNAHAWVEAYFPTVGWVAFDPTPGRSLPSAGASSTSPGFVNPFTENGTPGSNTVDTIPRGGRIPEGQTADDGATTSQAEGWVSKVPWLPWAAGAVALLVLWPVGRALWRRRGLRRGSLEQRLVASLRLLRSELSDFGLATSPSDTVEDTLQTIRDHVGLETDQAFADRTGAILFGGRSARSRDVARVDSLRRSVMTQLRKRHGWLRTVLAWYGFPRPASRRSTRAIPVRPSPADIQ
jgi:transglutaminase-like putative cysteine protease